MKTKHTSFAYLTKSPSDGSGRFEALVYSAGEDIDGVFIDPSGVRSAVAAFQKRNRPLILRVQHSADPEAAIGLIDRVWSNSAGTELYIAGQLNLQSPVAQTVYENWLTLGDANEFSIAWAAEDGYKADDGMHITQLELLEVSSVAMGANRGTRLISVKAAPVTDPFEQMLLAWAQESDPEQRKRLELDIQSVRTGLPAAAFDADEYGRELMRAAKAAEAASLRATEKAQLAARANAVYRPIGRVVVDAKFRPIEDELNDPREADLHAREAERIAREEAEREQSRRHAEAVEKARRDEPAAFIYAP